MRYEEIIKPNEKKFIGYYRSSLKGVYVDNKTQNNTVKCNMDNEKLRIESVDNIEFYYEDKTEGFPMQTQTITITDEYIQ